jgi:hypothetical protein
MSALRSLLLVLSLQLISACSDSNYHLSINFPGVLETTVLDAADGTPISNATISVVNADTQARVAWLLSDAEGHAAVHLEQGAYTLRISAQGYLPSPPAGEDALPLQVLNNLTTRTTLRLQTDPDAVNSAQLHGTVQSPSGAGINGVLLVAKDAAQGITLTTTSASDGSFRLYNVPPGNYALEGLIAGYRQVTSPGSITIAPAATLSGVERILERSANADLSGKVSFLAVVNGIVDITLLQPQTRDPIPGLDTANSAGGNTYRLEAVPPGEYIAWASYGNDGYVMDPDSIRKFGLPTVSFTPGGSDQQQDFNVTDAITLIAPTNPPQWRIPQVVSNSEPLFQWQPYPSAKEYIIEVRDAQGAVIWGGYDGAGTILHTPIGAASTTVRFNFDGSASAPLVAGATYRWKLYADNDAAANIQGLISASEQQMGLFRYQP